MQGTGSFHQMCEFGVCNGGGGGGGALHAPPPPLVYLPWGALHAPPPIGLPPLGRTACPPPPIGLPPLGRTACPGPRHLVYLPPALVGVTPPRRSSSHPEGPRTEQQVCGRLQGIRAAVQKRPGNRVLLDNSASPGGMGGWGGGANPPPPRTRISLWEKMKFTKGNMDWGCFWCTKNFGVFRFQDPPPPFKEHSGRKLTHKEIYAKCHFGTKSSQEMIHFGGPHLNKCPLQNGHMVNTKPLFGCEAAEPKRVAECQCPLTVEWYSPSGLARGFPCQPPHTASPGPTCRWSWTTPSTSTLTVCPRAPSTPARPSSHVRVGAAHSRGLGAHARRLEAQSEGPGRGITVLPGALASAAPRGGGEQTCH